MALIIFDRILDEHVYDKESFSTRMAELSKRTSQELLEARRLDELLCHAINS
jgi:hypothetical protein